MTSYNDDTSKENNNFRVLSQQRDPRLSRNFFHYLPVSLGLIWLILIISLYYINHKPFSPQQVVRFLNIVFQIGSASALIMIGGGLGRRFLLTVGLNPLSRLSIQAALGIGVISIGFLFWGSLVGLNSIYIWIGTIILGVLLWRFIWQWCQDWRYLFVLWQQSSRIARALAGGILIILLFTLISSLSPPLKFDALVYHLSLPQIYLKAQKINYVPQIMFWGMPQLGEMLYTWAIGLAGLQAATILGWSAGLLAMVGLVGFMVDNVNILAAWVSASSLIAGFSLATALAWGYVDWFTILFGIAFVISLHHWKSEQDPMFLRLAGVFSGMAFGTKYSAGILFISGVIAILWYTKEHFSVKRVLIQLTQYLLWAGLFSLPWLIKNFIATGNPFYPLFFPAGAMDEFRIDLYQNGSPWGNWLDTILLPFRATFLGVEMKGGYSSSIGPLLLSFGALASLSWINGDNRNRSVAGIAAVISIPGLVIWAILGRTSNYLLQSRLYYSIFPALAILAGIGFDCLIRFNLPGVRLWRVVGVFAGFVLWLNVFNVGNSIIQQDAPGGVLGLTSRDKYLEENLGWYAVAMQTISDLPENANVLMLWEPRSLYCAPKCTPDDILDRWLHDRATWNSTEAILDSWRKAGYTHLLYYRAGVDFLRENDQNYHPEDWQAFEELLSQLQSPVNFGNAYSLYPLNP